MGIGRQAMRWGVGFVGRLLAGLGSILLLVACAMPGDAAPVVKIGLIAPFEGVGRPLGYAVLPEVKAAIAEANASGMLGRYRAALVALNDDLAVASAAAQAQTLAHDDAVLAILGPFEQGPGTAAAAVAAKAGIPILVAAPIETTSDAALALCPPVTEIAVELSAVSAFLNRGAIGGDPAQAPLAVFFPGDALAAADVLIQQRGAVVVGPDALRPWFIQRAGAAGEGTVAAACSLAGASPVVGADLPEAHLARAAADALMQALAADIRTHGHPSRQGLIETLPRQEVKPVLRWYWVQNRSWQPLEGAILPPESPDAPVVGP